MLLRCGHQLVVRRVELDRINAVALRIVRTQPRAITVGIEAEPVQLVAGQGSVHGQAWR